MSVSVSDIVHLILALAATCVSAGFLVIVAKLAWVLRGWVEGEKTRAETNKELVGMVRKFVETQQQTNELTQAGLRLLGARVTKLESEKPQ